MFGIWNVNFSVVSGYKITEILILQERNVVEWRMFIPDSFLGRKGHIHGTPIHLTCGQLHQRHRAHPHQAPQLQRRGSDGRIVDRWE